MGSSETEAIFQGILQGDRKSIARAISAFENDAVLAGELLKRMETDHRKILSIGVTGAPGCGKSTLIGALAERMAEEGRKVGIIAVDPSSPISGGAILGDRIRMQSASAHDNVYIRSMSSRGMRGGLSRAVEAASSVLSIAGMNVVFIETVGAGQSDIDVAAVVDVTVIVLAPESGDEIQGLKAGQFEIADLIVINKSDIPGSERLRASLKSTQQRQSLRILTASAREGSGLDEVVGELNRLSSLVGTRSWTDEKRVKIRAVLLSMVAQSLSSYVMQELRESGLAETVVEDIANGRVSLQQASDQIATLFLNRLNRGKQ